MLIVLLTATQTTLLQTLSLSPLSLPLTSLTPLSLSLSPEQNVNSTTHRNTDNTSSNSLGLSSRFNRPILPSSDGSVPSAFGEPSCSSSLFGAGSAVVLVLGLEEVLQGNRGSCMLLCCPSPQDGRISKSSSKAQRQWCFPGRVHGFCMRSSTRPIPMQN